MSTSQQRIGEKHVITLTAGHEGSPVREARRRRRGVVWFPQSRALSWLLRFLHLHHRLKLLGGDLSVVELGGPLGGDAFRFGPELEAAGAAGAFCSEGASLPSLCDFRGRRCGLGGERHRLRDGLVSDDPIPARRRRLVHGWGPPLGFGGNARFKPVSGPCFS